MYTEGLELAGVQGRGPGHQELHLDLGSCIHVYMYTYIHVYIYIYIYVYIYIYTCI